MKHMATIVLTAAIMLTGTLRAQDVTYTQKAQDVTDTRGQLDRAIAMAKNGPEGGSRDGVLRWLEKIGMRK